MQQDPEGPKPTTLLDPGPTPRDREGSKTPTQLDPGPPGNGIQRDPDLPYKAIQAHHTRDPEGPKTLTQLDLGPPRNGIQVSHAKGPRPTTQGIQWAPTPPRPRPDPGPARHGCPAPSALLGRRPRW